MFACPFPCPQTGLLNFLNSTTPSNFAFYIDIVRVPDSVWKNGTANKIDLNSYLLDTMGYDCVLDRAVEASDQALYAIFLHVRVTPPRAFDCCRHAPMC